MRKTVFAMLLTLILVFSLIGSVSAITDGELDGDGHPAVVLIIMDVDGAPAYRCSGTLINEDTVITAGHCTSNYPDSPYTGIRIFTESDVQNGDNTYPAGGGPNSVEAVEWFTHPLFETAPFYYHDVGIIKLAEPVVLDEDQYGQLPEADQLDVYATKRGLDKLTFTAVGYGLQKSFPTAAGWKDQALKIRMVAYPKLIQINVPGSVGDFALLLSNNTNTGGTCFGDSGGANFIGDTMVLGAVTSFGKNGNCAGQGGVFRLDRQNVLDFIYSHLDP